MKDLNITKGVWEIKNNGSYLEVKIEDENVGAICSVFDCEIDNLITKENQCSNSRLIADAGNMAQKCGLLPSELLKQKNDIEFQLSICEETLETSERLRRELAQELDKMRVWKKEQIEVVEPLLDELKNRKGITEKELKIAAKDLNLQFGVIGHIINAAKKVRYDKVAESKLNQEK